MAMAMKMTSYVYTFACKQVNKWQRQQQQHMVLLPMADAIATQRLALQLQQLAACSIVSSKCNKRMCVCVYAGVFTEMLSSKWVKHFVAAYLCCCCRCCCWLAVGMCLACGMHYYASRMPQLEIVTFNHHLTISQRSKYVCAAMIRQHGWKSAAQTVKRLVPNHCWASFSHICVNFASFHSILGSQSAVFVLLHCFCFVRRRGSHFSLATLQLQRIYWLCAQNWLKYFQLIWVLQSVVGILWNQQLTAVSMYLQLWRRRRQRALRATRKH